jgi:hypothetical protein
MIIKTHALVFLLLSTLFGIVEASTIDIARDKSIITTLSNIEIIVSKSEAIIDEEITFELQDANDIDGVTWDFGDGFSTTAISPTHSFSAEGDYVVTCTIKSGLVSTKKGISITILSSKKVAGDYCYGIQYIYDCNLKCVDIWTKNGALSDGNCHDGTISYDYLEFAPSFNCTEFEYDGGDCSSSTIDSTVDSLPTIPSQNSYTLSLNKSWNLVSLPTTISSTSSYFQGSGATTIWTYDKSWSLNPSTISQGQGFWVNMSSAADLSFSGDSYLQAFNSLNTGWNLLGTGEDITVPSYFTTTWTFSSGVWSKNPTTVLRGQGFWASYSGDNFPPNIQIGDNLWLIKEKYLGWEDAVEYCKANSGRLPSDDELIDARVSNNSYGFLSLAGYWTSEGRIVGSNNLAYGTSDLRYQKQVKCILTNDLTQKTNLNSFVNDIGLPDIHFNDLTYKQIRSPFTDRIWLDRNLGAIQSCTSSTDEKCYGDYYQYMRATDGHEKADSHTLNGDRSSSSSGSSDGLDDLFANTCPNGTDSPYGDIQIDSICQTACVYLDAGHAEGVSLSCDELSGWQDIDPTINPSACGACSSTRSIRSVSLSTAGSSFVYGTQDWLYNRDDIEDPGGWTKDDGSGICPEGFRVPTIREVEDETKYLQVANDGYSHFLKIPKAGERFYLDATFRNVGEVVAIWSSSANTNYGSTSEILSLTTDPSVSSGVWLASGLPVRCISVDTYDKDCTMVYFNGTAYYDYEGNKITQEEYNECKGW